ncbi:5-dehydro-4-deoxy-D-glucuronate isomerase, partial [Candidatus Epulonipiscioides saccharophilum]
MDIRYSCSPKEMKTMDTAELRKEFLVDNLFNENEIVFVYSHVDRMITGGLKPTKPVELVGGSELKSQYFLERREMGVVNIGAEGIITADGQKYVIGHREALYIGRGTKQVIFESTDNSNPAKFYMNSSPAHKNYKTVAIKLTGQESDNVVLVKPENRVELGSLEDSNHRIIYKYILPGQVESCQLVMGMTSLKPGSVWNTMPTHT